MVNSETAPSDDQTPPRQARGRGRGSKFFALGRDVWETLWAAETANRQNFVLAHLVLLAGTGSDHRLSKWSAKACEHYLGMGKPRAKRAIQELMLAGLVKLTDKSTRLAPQYELPSLPIEDDPIFLPVQLVTGFSGETPVLRRVKETGDPLLLRMLIDLYGLITLDAPFGVPIAELRNGGLREGQPNARRIANVGAHAVWAITCGGTITVSGEWTTHHRVKAKGGQEDWDPLWERLDLLKQIGALYYEPWLFDSPALDAEPLMPLDPSAFFAVSEQEDEARLTKLANDAAAALIAEEQSYLLETSADYLVPLPLHYQAPALRLVARLRVEADTPGRRLAWRRRREIVEGLTQSYQELIEDAKNGSFDRPMRPVRNAGE